MKEKIVLAVVIFALSVAAAAKPPQQPASSLTPLIVFFQDGANPSNCNFVYLPTGGFFAQAYGNPTGTAVTYPNGHLFAYRSTVEERDRLLLEIMVKVGALDLVPDDFIDTNTGSYECTNDKLMSLL
jgi:hypothetical protein